MLYFPSNTAGTAMARAHTQARERAVKWGPRRQCLLSVCSVYMRTWDCVCSCLLGEQALKDGPIKVGLLCAWRVVQVPVASKQAAEVLLADGTSQPTHHHHVAHILDEAGRAQPAAGQPLPERDSPGGRQRSSGQRGRHFVSSYLCCAAASCWSETTLAAWSLRPSIQL